MARPTYSSIFIRRLRECGGRSSNVTLQKNLEWPEDRYWNVHTELLDAGLIVKGRGYGGTVILVVPDDAQEARLSAAALPLKEIASVTEELVEASNEAAAQPETREIDLYKPTLAQLQKNWPQDKKLLHGVFEITASQGRRETGGSWSRPDLVAVGLRKFEYLPDRVLEIYSFEVKAEYDVSIKGVLEALAHREASTRAYVVFHTNGKEWDDFPEAQRIEQLAARHGVGVIVASDISNFDDGWDERVTATRSNADPEVLDSFIKRTLKEDTKSQIRRWF